MTGSYTIVGRSVERLDGGDKVSGKAVYIDDLSLPGMLFAQAVRSPHAHALVRGVDASRARAMPGVVTVLTASDVPGANRCGMDQPVLAGEKVRFLGEAVALVVAESPAAAAAAAGAVDVDYEVLPAVFDVEEAVAGGAPAVHEGGNVACEAHLRRGDVSSALAAAHLVVTNTFRVPTVDHVFLEPNGAVAAPTRDAGGDGGEGGQGLTVWATTKMVGWIAPGIGRMLGIDPSRVRIIAATVGGSFGGKPDSPVTWMAALAAHATGRPVKMVYTREENMQVSVKRHSAVLTYTHAVDADGRILAVKIDILANAGAYTNASRGVIGKNIHHGVGPYYVPNAEIRTRAIFTNLTVTGAMRGYGVPQVAFAHELQMDIIASKLRLDPIELRLRNVLKPGLTAATGQEMPEGLAAEACLLRMRDLLEREMRAEEAGAAREAWTSWVPARDWRADGRPVGLLAGRTGSTGNAEPKVAGWGVAFSFYGNGAGPNDVGRCRLRRETDGTYTLFVGIPDTGQGSTTALAQIACEELGVPLDSLKMVTADTALTPETGPAAATRVTVIVGRAVQDACWRMKEEIAERESRVDRWTEPIEVIGEFQGDGVPLDENGQGAPYINYTFGAQAMRVTVDTGTGQVEVNKVLSVFDTGCVVNPVLYEGQMEGGILTGIGYALFEDVKTDQGRITNTNLHTYLIPTMPDAPPVETHTVLSSDSKGPFAAKGIGEPSIIPTAPAVTIAVYRATGLRFLSIPITPERVYRGLRTGKVEG